MTVKHDILATLSYFDLFEYPLTGAEIYHFAAHPYPQSEFSEALVDLTLEGWIYKFEDFYLLRDQPQLVQRRLNGNLKARKMLKTAEKIASFLSAFPFVRGVAVSGSLSKNFADEKSDIDFFIITAPNRLWLARTLMHLFKKLTFLVHREDWFCMNYYVDEEMLRIREKNIYTAMEVVTLLPFRGINVFQKFFSENRWSRDFLPNHSMRVSYVEEARTPWIKKITEFLLDHPLGNLMDVLLMKLTAWKWGKKIKNKKLNRRGIIMGMDATRHYAKPDPHNFQYKLVEAYEEKIFQLLLRYRNKAKTIY